MTPNGEKMRRIAGNVRRQFGTDATTRFLRNLPLFRVEQDMPEHFRDLLDRLDRSERSAASRNRRR